MFLHGRRDCKAPSAADHRTSKFEMKFPNFLRPIFPFENHKCPNFQNRPLTLQITHPPFDIN